MLITPQLHEAQVIGLTKTADSGFASLLPAHFVPWPHSCMRHTDCCCNGMWPLATAGAMFNSWRSGEDCDSIHFQDVVRHERAAKAQLQGLHVSHWTFLKTVGPSPRPEVLRVETTLLFANMHVDSFNVMSSTAFSGAGRGHASCVAAGASQDLSTWKLFKMPAAPRSKL